MAETTSAEAWFAANGYAPFDFQREVWAAMAAGASGLLHATTGSGKTYAVWMGALARLQPPAGRTTKGGLQVLWLTPMRALAADTTKALQRPLLSLVVGTVLMCWLASSTSCLQPLVIGMGVSWVVCSKRAS